MAPDTALRPIELAPTIIWGIFIVLIIAVYIFAAQAKFASEVWAIATVFVEITVLKLHHVRCPFNGIVGRSAGLILPLPPSVRGRE